MKSAFEIIRESLESYQGHKKVTSDHVMICCPFHDDASPSLGVYVAEGLSIPIGSFNCFGCNTSGNWNKLAEKCGFPKIKEWNIELKDHTKDIQVDNKEVSLKSLMSTLKAGYTDWPPHLEWRGFDGAIIDEVGGLLIDDRFTKSISVFFPIYIGNSLKGGIKAAFKKEKNVLSYVTTSGSWVKKYGLFLFEQVKSMNKNFVILTEGPRDALRLYEAGLPALAILGSKNFGEHKALVVSSLFPDFVIVLPDNDKAGNMMKKLVKEHMGKYCKTVSIKLPEDVNDPADMSDSDIKALKKVIKSI